MSVNKVILVGNVGKDPEVRYLENGTPVANFTLATNERYTNKNGEKITNTEWHNLVLWRGLATIAEKYIKKGSQIFIEGRIKTRSYDDKEGNKRYTTEIVADNLQLLGRRDDEGASQSAQPTSTPEANPQPTASPTEASNSESTSDVSTPAKEEGDDLPF